MHVAYLPKIDKYVRCLYGAATTDGPSQGQDRENEMMPERGLPKSAERCALPRDISRFKKLYENGRAVIKSDPDKTLGYVSTVELVNETVKTAA